MKTLRIALLLQLLVAGYVKSQNWNVFNAGYRYNYKYNYSTLVSQVLFADSVKKEGTDSVYYMNRIGVKCTGNCYGITTPATITSAIIPNMPQFLQRKIKKNQNGLVILYDTAKFVIDPNCNLNQTWQFDSINNKNAVCSAIGVKNIFGITDSVKTIIVGGTDSIQLSKSFGLILFPDVYNKNKYYRITGIEHAASYDSIPFYGERVPNAWDFYRYNSGDKFCYKTSWAYDLGNYLFSCLSGNKVINQLHIVSNGYNYDLSDNWDTCSTGNPRNSTDAPGSSVSGAVSGLSGALKANRMYPGMIMGGSLYSQNTCGFTGPNPNCAFNIVEFNMDSHGVFYKTAGKTCTSIFPQPGVASGYAYYSQGYYGTAMAEFSEVYGVGLGLVSQRHRIPGELHDYCLNCAVKGGQNIFGAETYVGINEQSLEAGDLKLYPNPSSGKVNLAIGDVSISTIDVISPMGQKIVSVSKDLRNQTIELDLSNESKGIYFIVVSDNQKILKTAKIIRE